MRGENKKQHQDEKNDTAIKTCYLIYYLNTYLPTLQVCELEFEPLFTQAFARSTTTATAATAVAAGQVRVKRRKLVDFIHLVDQTAAARSGRCHRCL